MKKHRNRIAQIYLVGILAGTSVGFLALKGGEVLADAGGGSAVITAPTPAATPVETPAPAAHDKLHDPITEPGATWDDLKAAKKTGIPVLCFAIAFLVARLLGKYGPKVFSSLGKGRTAVVIAGVGVALGTCYDAAFAGGSWVAIGAALVVAVATFINPHAAA